MLGQFGMSMCLPHTGSSSTADSLDRNMISFQQGTSRPNKAVQMFISWICHQSTEVQVRQTGDQLCEISRLIRRLHSTTTRAGIAFYKYSDSQSGLLGSV